MEVVFSKLDESVERERRIERAGADGEATQEELDNCINANLGEVRAAMPDVAMDTPDETPYRMGNAMSGETAEGDTEEES